ncbi:hypothetical protein [Peribacillus simplex]|uniref:hypothetical protein n=1 Tax=Peribacillus simplex TaxID=1478 RepID=UPI003D2CCC0D
MAKISTNNKEDEKLIELFKHDNKIVNNRNGGESRSPFRWLKGIFRVIWLG